MNVIFYLAYDIQHHIWSENVKLRPVCMKRYYGRLYKVVLNMETTSGSSNLIHGATCISHQVKTSDDQSGA